MTMTSGLGSGLNINESGSKSGSANSDPFERTRIKPSYLYGPQHNGGKNTIHKPYEAIVKYVIGKIYKSGLGFLDFSAIPGPTGNSLKATRRVDA